MTQAGLSPDLQRALGAPPPMSETEARTDVSSEASLWLIALTSSGLVGAAALLLSLLAGGVAPDASFGGFVSGIAVMIATLGVGAMAYTLVVARRQGLIGADGRVSTGRPAAVPAGMHVVPALPPDLGLRRHRAQEAERAARSRQARAIATAAAARSEARPVVKHHAAPPPKATTATRPAAPAPPTAERVAPAVAPRVTQDGPIPQRPAPHSPKPASIRMPRPNAQQARPGPWPKAAPARMPAAHPMPRTQAVLFQVRAAHVRPSVPYGPR